MSNKLRRQRRHEKRKAAQVGCEYCLPIALTAEYFDTLRAKLGDNWRQKFGMVTRCPFCQRELWLPVIPHAIEQFEPLRKVLRGYGALVAARLGLSVSAYDFRIGNNFTIFADPPCGCSRTANCLRHPRVVVQIEATDLSDRNANYAEVGRTVAQILQGVT